MSLPYRTGFGTGNYGVRAFGLDGTVTESVGSGTLVSGVVSSAEVIKLGSASGSASASVGSPTGEFMIDAASAVSASASTTSAGEVIYLGEGTATAEVTDASASLQFITNASASISASASFTSAGVRVRIGAPTVTSAATFDAQAFITAVGALAISGVATTADLDGLGYRVRIGEGNTIQGSSSFASIGREKWEPISYTSTTWSNVA